MLRLPLLIVAALVSSATARAQGDEESPPPRTRDREEVAPAAKKPEAVALVSLVRGFGAGSDKAAGFVAHYMRGFFAEDPRYTVIAVDEALASTERAEAQQALVRADNLFATGRTAYDSLDLDQAVESLNGAVRELERYAGQVQDVEKVTQILMLLGATHILRGEDGKGRERLAQALLLNPELQADPTIFNPSMRAIFKAAQQQVNRARKGSLSINSNPSYAEVYVNGRFVGVTPTTVDDIVEGRHYLRIVKDGFLDYGNVVTVKATGEVTDTAELRPVTSFSEYEDLVTQTLEARNAMVDAQAEPSSELVTQASQLGAMLGADHLFVTDVRLDGERVVLRATQIDLEAEAKMKTASHAFAYDSQAATYEREIDTFMNAHFGPETLARETEGAQRFGIWGTDQGLVHAGSRVCLGMPCDVARSKLILLGAVVGSGATLIGGVTAYLGKRDYESFKDKPQGSADADGLERSGKIKAVIGDAFLIIGGATLVTTAVLYLFYHPATTPEDVVTGTSQQIFDLTPALTSGGGALIGTWRF